MMADDRSDREQITDVLIRYATGIDTRDWALFRTCFTADVHADYGAVGVWKGVDAITDYMDATHKDMVATNHMMSNVAIDENGDAATVTSDVHAVLAFSEQPPEWVDAVGRYVDEFVRTGDGWRIRARTFRLTRVVMSDPPAPETA
jgi:3-phenylpropionate/cinnamic acid dioxygenase small subunit